VEENGVRYKGNQDLYRKRQEINEHIFGTIKRKWGYNHTNLKGLEKVNGEFALIMTVYNMKRCMNILGFEKLLEKIAKWKPDYKRITGFLFYYSIYFLLQQFIFLKHTSRPKIYFAINA
jgi:hypothetical protein